jgi:asparagine N-glycosylation enzyme membrane subunit Stt3
VRDRLERNVSVATLVTAAIVAAITVGILVRAFHVLSSDFPLNDGGMFFAMARDLQDNGYRLPEFTTYNGGNIPFTYPPLGFYAAALMDDLTPLGMLDVFRWLPLIATSLTVPAFYLLARSMLNSRVALVASVLAFALVPRSFMWLLMGGGVTRSLGLLFAILALYFAHRLYAKEDRSALPWAIVASVLTILSHLETGWFLAFSIGIFFLAYGRNRRGLTDSVILASGTFVGTAIWWLPVLSMHGFEPITTVSGAGGSIFSGGEATRGAYLGLLRVMSTSEPLFPLIGVLAAFGGLVCLSSRRFLLPVWWVAIILLDVRAFPTFTTIPVAMMAGICVSEVLLPMLEGRQPGARTELTAATARLALPRMSAQSVVLAGLIVFAIGSALLRSNGLSGEAPYLRGLSDDEQQALSWVEEETPANSTFLVIPDSSWETAKTAEWFPVLADRYSIATVQGTEWLSNGGFERARKIYDHAYSCGYQTTECLNTLVEDNTVDFDYVYIRRGDPGQCCTTLLDSLMQDAHYELVYAGDGATIYVKQDEDPPSVLAPDE